MKKLIIALLIGAAANCAMAGAFMVYIKMPDGKTQVVEMSGVPRPDKDGMFRLRVNRQNIVVHASNVWFVEK
jgi:hypothetical protein